ncbi:MAG: hypothetical protein AB1817_21855, partial [Chloroflexota bacterium]
MKNRMARLSITIVALFAVLSCSILGGDLLGSGSPAPTSSASQPPSAPQAAAPTGSIVVDNANPGFAIQAGDWGTCARGQCSGVAYNTDFRYADPSCANCRARFDLPIANAGSYELYIWWPHGDDRATDTPFTIQYSGGTINLQVDQRNSGDDWFWFHTLNVKAGETVSIFVGGSKTGFANADAVALFPTGAAPSAAQPNATTRPLDQPTTRPATAPAAGKPATVRRVIFLHHSTGQGLIDQGNLRQRLTALGYEFFDHGYNDAGLTLANGQSANMNFNI